MANDDIVRLFHRKMRHAIHEEGDRAVVGRSDGTVHVTTDGGQIVYSKIWVTYLTGEASVGEVAVRRGDVPFAEGTPVRIVERNGRPTAILEKYSNATITFTNGGQSGVVGYHLHNRLGIMPHYAEDLTLGPLLVRSSSPLALTVYVQAGWYEYRGIRTSWRGGDSGSLAAYVPAADDGSIAYVAICIDMITNAIAIVDGGTVEDTDPIFPAAVTMNEVEAIAFPGSYLPLAIVQLTFGQTTVLTSHISHDLRAWGGSHSGSSQGGGWLVDYDALIPSGTDAFIPGTVTVLSGYTLTASGDLYIV